MDPPYGGSVVRTATATPNKPRQRGHAIATLSFATTYLYFIYLLDAIVTSFVVLYLPPRNVLPILPSILAIVDVNTPISTRSLSRTRDRCPPCPMLQLLCGYNNVSGVACSSFWSLFSGVLTLSSCFA